VSCAVLCWIFRLPKAFRNTAAISLILYALGANHPTFASNETQPSGVGSKEIWMGADAGLHNWLVYSGTTYAPFDDIHGDGFRLRSTAGYGRYTYQWNAKTRIDVPKTTADVLVGYQQRFGSLTAKVFAGAAMLGDLTVLSAKSQRPQTSLGVKGAVELWLNLGDDAFTSLDVTYADTRNTASLRSRTGYRILPTVSVGAEVAINHSNLAGQVQIVAGAPRELGNVRLGGFARYEWFGGEVSASVGLTGDVAEDLVLDNALKRPQAYGTANWIVQF
jgi:hypothetical protein